LFYLNSQEFNALFYLYSQELVMAAAEAFGPPDDNGPAHMDLPETDTKVAYYGPIIANQNSLVFPPDSCHPMDVCDEEALVTTSSGDVTQQRPIHDTGFQASDIMMGK
jgi:hypothetical protein